MPKIVIGKVLKNFLEIIKKLGTCSRPFCENKKLEITKNMKMDVTIYNDQKADKKVPKDFKGAV